MKKLLLYPAIAFELFWHLIAWAVVPFALLFMRKTDEQNYNDAQYRGVHIQRYRLPWLMRWMGTPDMLLPGGIYEKTVMKIYDFFYRNTYRLTKKEAAAIWVASYFTAWYWLGIRNIGQGILWPFGWEVPKGTQHDVTTLTFNLSGKTVYIVYGSEVNHDILSTKTDKGYWMVPGYFSIRFSAKGEL